MKKCLILAIVLLVVFSIPTACSVAKKDTPIKGKYDSFKLKIQDAHMTKDFGLYGEMENEVGIVLYGDVENGKIHENSDILFVDENGEVLYNDKVFKMEIIEYSSSTSTKKRRQNFAESGDNIALYLKVGKGDDLALFDKYEDILDLIRKSQFAVSE